MIRPPDTTALSLIVFFWAVAAYLIVPQLWARHYRRHPFFTQAARITLTGNGHPGDPINIGLVGSEGDAGERIAESGRGAIARMA